MTSPTFQQLEDILGDKTTLTLRRKGSVYKAHISRVVDFSDLFEGEGICGYNGEGDTAEEAILNAIARMPVI